MKGESKYLKFFSITLMLLWCFEEMKFLSCITYEIFKTKKFELPKNIYSFTSKAALSDIFVLWFILLFDYVVLSSILLYSRV